MVDRRKFITSVATAGTIAIAGCSSDEGDPTGSTEDNESPEESSDEQTASGGAQFEFVEWNVPSEVEINEEFELGMMVENTGSEVGSFTAPLYQRTPESDWSEISELNFETIQPGEQNELSFTETSFAYINRYELRLGDFEQTAVLQTVSAKIDWGTEYTTPSGYVIRVEEPTLQSSYTYEDYTGAESEKQPESGGQWAFLDVYVKNETGQSEYSPLASDFKLVYGNSQADGDTILIDDPTNKGEPFEGGELQPGIERSGWVAYEIPDDISSGDVTIAWSATTFDGEIAVNWE